MADGIELNAGTGGATLATDDDGTVHHQYVKLEFGADNTQTKVDGSNPLPVVQTGALPAGGNAIGKLAANSGVDIGDVDVTSSALPTGASTEATLSALAGDLGDSADAEAAGNGSLIAILKRVRTLLTKNSRSDTYTGTGNGTTVDVSTQGVSRYAVQVKGTGAAPTSWTVHVDVSVDGTNFQSLYTHTNSDPGDGGVKWGPVGHYPALYFRTRCSALVLGSATNIVVTVVALP